MEYERLELPQPLYGTVNCYRVGDTLVDTGHVQPACRERVREELDGGVLDGVERVVLTHPHIDHVGGSQTLPELTALPHVVPEGTPALLREYESYLREARREMWELGSGLTGEADGEPPEEREDPYFPLDLDYAAGDVRVERVVRHGDSVRVGPYDCEVVHTPGHSRQHAAFHHAASGTMLSGDVISTNGHFMYGPVYWDVGEYRTSLERVGERDPSLLLPGHGDPMDDPGRRVAEAVEKADRTERAVVEAVEAHGELAAHELAREALGATDESVSFLTMVASAYAVHLADRGELAVERRPYVVARAVE